MPTTIELPSNTSPRTARRCRGRTALLASGAAVGALALSVGALTVANHAMTKHDRDSFTASGIREIVIDQDAGDVDLVASATAGEVTVETSSRWAWSKPRSAHTIQDGVLTLTGDCANFAVGSVTSTSASPRPPVPAFGSPSTQAAFTPRTCTSPSSTSGLTRAASAPPA